MLHATYSPYLEFADGDSRGGRIHQFDALGQEVAAVREVEELVLAHVGDQGLMISSGGLRTCSRHSSVDYKEASQAQQAGLHSTHRQHADPTATVTLAGNLLGAWREAAPAAGSNWAAALSLSLVTDKGPYINSYLSKQERRFSQTGTPT